jgi:methionyl-tRNA formyltransferase
MRMMIVGQKFFGAEVLRMCLARGDDVAAVSAPAPG